MDCTQALDDLQFEDNTTYKEGEKKQLGYLEIGGVKHMVFSGKNLIGRDASCCSVSVSSKALSKEHAVIEVMDENNHLIYDLGSRNKTRLGKMVLHPHVRYQLSDGAILHLADVSAVYHRLSNNLEVDDESSSETGSESMLAVNNSVVEGTVIVPETPGPLYVRTKSVVTVAESPCSPSDADSSFGVTSTGKSDKFVGKDKELKNHPEWEKDISDDSIYEAETQCDIIDCLDVSERPTSKLLCSSVSHEGKNGASALDQEEDMFEAETQCEEPSFRGTVKLFSPSGQRKQDLILTSGIADVEDIYEIKTQCVLDDGLSETVKHVAVSNENLVQKSSEQENVKVCKINQKLKVDHVIAKDVNYVSDKHVDKIYDSSAQCLLRNADVISMMDEKGVVGVCSEQTKDCVHDDGSQNSHVDVKNSVQGKVDVTDSNILVKRKASGSQSEISELCSSNISVQQEVQLDRSHEKISSTVTKISLDVSCSEDSFDRSLLEGDEEFFNSPAAQTSECKETAPKTNKTFIEIHQEGSKSESNCTNSDGTVTNLSKQCTIKQSASEKTLAAAVTFDKCTANKLSSVQATTQSLSCNKKETAKLCDDSGDETDPENIFEGSTQIISPPVTNRKVISNQFETLVAVHGDSIKPAIQSPTDLEDNECKNKVTKKQSKVVVSDSKNNREFIKPHDSLKEDSLPSVPSKSAVVSTEKEKTPTRISTELKDSDDDDDDDDIYEAPTQILFTPNKNRDLTELPISSQEETTDIPPVMHSCRMEVLRQLNYASQDYDNDDSVFEAATQIVETTNTSSKDFTKPVTSFTGKQKKNAAPDYDDESVFEAATQIIETTNTSSKDFTKPVTSFTGKQEKNAAPDYDDESVFEAATQIVETTNTSNKDLTKPVTSSPVEQMKNTASDYDDSIFEAATQILEAPNRSGKEFTKVCTSSPIEEQISAGHDDSDTVSEAAVEIVETQNRTSDGFTNTSGISLENDAVSIPTPIDDHISENLSSSSGNKGPKDLGNKTHVTDTHSFSAEKLNYAGNRAIEYKESCTSVQKPVTAELKKQDGGATHAQRQGDENHELVASRNSNVTQLPSRKGGVVNQGMAKSTHHNTACLQNLGIKEKKESRDISVRAKRSGDEQCRMEDSKKLSDFIINSLNETYRTPRIEELNQYDTTAGDLLVSQKEYGKDKVEGLKIPGDTKSSLCDDPNEETDPKHLFEANSQKMKVKKNADDKLNIVKKTVLPIASGESAQIGGKNDVIGTFSTSLIHIEDALPLSFEHTEGQNESSLVRCTKSTTSGGSCSSKEANAVAVALGNVNSNNFLNVPSSKCDTVTAETICASIHTSKMNLKSEKVTGQSVDTGKNLVSNKLVLSTMSATVRSLPRDQITENREQKQNSDMQGYVPADHSKDVDESQKILVGTKEIALVSKQMEPENSYIQNENDSKSYSGISQQIPLEHHKAISGEHGRVVDITDASVYESLNDMSKLIIPSSHNLTNAVRESEAKESLFKTNELTPSEDELPMPTVKPVRRSHLTNKRAKDRRKLNIESRHSDVSAGASRRHLPDEGSTDVSVMSKTAAGISRTRKRRTKLQHEDFVQSDTSDIQASKHRKLTSEDSLQNNSKNMASDIISFYSASGCAGEIQQSETEVVIVTDKEISGKGRKSKATTAKNKEQDKTVLSVEWSGEVKGGRSSEVATEPVKDNECKVTGKVRKEHIVKKNEDVENAVTISIRPSRQRKMTWKVQDTLGSDNSQGSITSVEERPKKRSRGSSSSNSKNLTNENRECSTGTTTRSRKVSAAKSPSKNLLKSSEDSGSDTCEEARKSKYKNFVTSKQSVSQRRSTRCSKVGDAVTSVSDMLNDQSLQQMTRQNNRKVVSNISQKKKNEETVTEVSSKHPKMKDQVFPDEKFKRNSTDKCHPKRSRSGLESYTDASIESDTRVSHRKRRETVNEEFVQTQSSDITLPKEDGKRGSVLKKPLCFSVGSFQECTGRNLRRRTEVMNASLSCLKEETSSVPVHASSRTRQGVKRTMLNTEGDDELLRAKQTKTEKRVTQPHSLTESGIQSGIIDCMPPSRTNITRSKVRSRQKLETAGTVKQDTDCGKREKTSKISNTEEANKNLKKEPLTPRSRMINLSEGQAVTPKRASRRGTPQSCVQHDIQKSVTNSGTRTPQRSSPRKVASSSRMTHQVLFTGFSDTKQESIVRQLGGSVVDLPESCSVLVTDKVRRTYKFLCIMGRGKPIVSCQWLVQSQRSGHFLDPWQFLIKDHESESKFQFQLRESLEAAAKTDLLAGYSVYVTPSVQPPPSEMGGIIESCGGVFMTQAPTKSWPVSSFIISCLGDKACWSKLKKSGKPIVGPELLLLGVLQQKLDLTSNVLV